MFCYMICEFIEKIRKNTYAFRLDVIFDKHEILETSWKTEGI